MASTTTSVKHQAFEPVSVLSPEHELFAVSISSGLSYRDSSRRSGFHEANGFRLMQMPAIRARIQELLQEPDECIRAGIDAEFVMLRNRVADNDLDSKARANVELRLKLLMAHARYHGWIVEKKQVAKASIDFGKVGPEELRTYVVQCLDSLEPGARQEIEARLKRRPKVAALPAPEPAESEA